MDKKDQLTQLPNPVFIQIFSHFDSNELLKLKLVSRRVNRLINKNIPYLERPILENVSFQMRHTLPKNGIKKRHKQLQIELRKNVRKPTKSLQFTENETDQNINAFIRQNIGQFRLKNSLAFRGCDLNSNLLQSLLHSTIDLSSVQKLSFEFCELISPNDIFYEFLRRTTCSKLVIDFCTNLDGCIINNKLFTCIKNLNSFQIQTKSPLDELQIDDSTIDYWLKQPLIPTKIDFNNSSSKFTVDGILRVIKTLQHNKSNASWNLGHCNGTILELLIRLQQSLNQSPNYSLCLQPVVNNRISVKIDLLHINNLKSPLEALENLANSPTNFTKASKQCELKFTLLNCRV